jgi:hypothetical protein
MRASGSPDSSMAGWRGGVRRRSSCCTPSRPRRGAGGLGRGPAACAAVAGRPRVPGQGVSVHGVIRAYMPLVERAIERLLKDGRRGAFPDFAVEPFAARLRAAGATSRARLSPGRRRGRGAGVRPRLGGQDRSAAEPGGRCARGGAAKDARAVGAGDAAD